ncbi:MAG: heavy metal translocating P-type ATPase [Enterococcus sp.]
MSTKEKQAFLSTIGCFIFLLSGWLTNHFQLPYSFILYIFAILLGGWKQTFEGLKELFFDHALNVDLLMTLAAIGACLIGNYFEGAMLTFIFCLSGALEEFATNKSTKEITALIDLQPKSAVKLSDTDERIETAITDLIPGDRVFVPKGQTVPIDGTLLSSYVQVDEAAINGESLPAEKVKGEVVFGGTMNVGNPFTMKVTKTSDETVVSQIVKLVEEAQNTPTQTATFINKIENHYVRVVLIAVILMIFLPHFFLNWTLEESFYRGMILLVVASPCALVASATPATLAALSNSAKHGILIKGGKYLEQLAEVKSIAFDKTGTLTMGRPRVTDALFLAEKELSQQMFLALEMQTTHPLATAVQDYFTFSLPDDLKRISVTEITGFGLEATYLGDTWRIGKHAIKQDTLPSSLQAKIKILEEEGKTVIYLSKNHQLMALLGLFDVERVEANSVIHYFNEHRVHTVMLTGDHEKTAQTVANKTGIQTVYANCLPEDKTAFIQQEKERYHTNAMLGDGINDAPALATASIGIAMGEGTDIAMDVADIVLMKNDLTKLIYSHQLALKLKRIIKQNILFSLLVIALLILSNFVQLLNLPLGVVGHEGSTILVILNGLRMLLPIKETNSRTTIHSFNQKNCDGCPLVERKNSANS